MSRKLQYFDLNGFGEATRYMLHYGKLDFEDIRHKRADWLIESIKETLPYGQLPLYEENGRALNQSLAIARYVASQVGLLPSDPWEQAQLDAAALNVYDLIIKLKPYFFDKDPQNEEENKKKIAEGLEYSMSRFEKELKAGNGHFLKGKLNWADFVLVSIVEVFDLWFPTSVGNSYPTVKALMAKINGLPGVKEYVAKRPPYSK